MTTWCTAPSLTPEPCKPSTPSLTPKDAHHTHTLNPGAPGSAFGVWAFSVRVQSSGPRVQGFGVAISVSNDPRRCRPGTIWGFGLRVPGFKYRVSGSGLHGFRRGFRSSNFGVRGYFGVREVSGFGRFRILGFGRLGITCVGSTYVGSTCVYVCGGGTCVGASPGGRAAAA